MEILGGWQFYICHCSRVFCFFEGLVPIGHVMCLKDDASAETIISMRHASKTGIMAITILYILYN